MCEWYFVAVCVGAVDVVKTYGDLCHHFQCVLSGFEDFGVDRVAQSGDKAVNARFYFVDDQAFRRGFGLRIDLDFVASVAKKINSFSDIAGGENAKFVSHEFPKTDESN